MTTPIKILVIDDETSICTGCRLAFSDSGHFFTTCADGKAGHAALSAEHFDLVLLDIKLPDMDGMDLLRQIRKTHPDTFIIVMTGFSTVENAVQAMKMGAFDYLAKPFSEDELKLAVDRAIDKKRLVEENISLRRELLGQLGFDNIIGEHHSILHIFEQIKKVAPTDSTVLLCGESGTGKEVFARSIHAHSKRAMNKFLAVDCSTLAPGLLESELFGHVKGAFTGAVQDKTGIFEIAEHGTLFLDDIANLSMETQGKLLRVIEMREYKPVGASVIKNTNVRIIAATNKDLKYLVEAELFRHDLFYRINVFPIFLPPLRERKEDIPRLAYHFLKHFCRQTGKKIQGFTDDALEVLINHEWTGNVRQLKNVIERLVIMADQTFLDLVYLLDHLQVKPSWQTEMIPDTLAELKAFKEHLISDRFEQTEKAFLIKALKAYEGNITHAAKHVGMQRSNFSTLMKKHHIQVDEMKVE